MNETEKTLADEHNEVQNETDSDVNGIEEWETDEECTDKDIPLVKMYLRDNAVTFIPNCSYDSDINECSSDLDQNSDLESDADNIPYEGVRIFDKDSSDLDVEVNDVDSIHSKEVKNNKVLCYSSFPYLSSGDKKTKDSNSSPFKKKRNLKSEFDVGTLECKKCELSFKEQHEYSQHLLNDHHHSKKGTFACGTCQKVFKREVTLNYHMAKHFCKSTLFSCTKCKKKFNNESALAKHMQFHEEHENAETFRSEITSKTCICSVCSAEVGCENSYKEHLLTHCDMGNFVCGLCNKKNQNLVKLKHHLRLHIESFECTICGQIFNRKDNLNRHIGIHTGEKNFSCSHCSKDFREKKDLRKHFHREHPEIYGPLLKKQSDEKSWKCKHCDRDFNNHNKYDDHTSHTICSICATEFGCENTYREHLLTHCSMENFICCFKLCNKKLENLRKLKHHLQFHIMTFECTTCGQVFNRKGNLKRHVGIHTGERNFVCSHCDRDFREKKDLQSHCHRKHPEIYGPLVKKRKRNPERHEDHVKPWKCEYCEKAFRYRSRYNDHMMCHTGDHPNAAFCPNCNKKFVSKSNLKRHYNRMHAEIKTVYVKPVLTNKYFCEVCGKGFPYPGDYKRHLESHSSIRNVCELCGLGFKLKKDLANHKNEDHSNNE